MAEENKNTEEAKIPYKGQLLTPQEFVEQYEQDTKKKERTSESIARQRLEIQKEKEEKRNALIEINLQQDQQDAQEKNNNPILGVEDKKRDMSLFQVDMPFDVQTGPNLQIIPTTSYEQPIQPNMSVDYRVGGLMSLMDDNKISSFKDGGKKKKTTKSKDGTVTNKFKDKQGNTITQVKTKDGKYFEKVKTKEQRKIDREKSLETLDQIKKSIKGPIISREEPTLEERAEYNLHNPMQKAYNISEHFAEKGEDPVDNFRHPMAGRYTAQAAYRLRKKDNPWAPEWLNKSAAWVDANMLGIGHEATTLFKDERPWSTKLREAGEDIYNNAVGVNVGLSDASGIEKTKYLFNKSINNELPDGVVDPKGKRNMYFKKK
jgi:hypothetical protein